MWQQHMRCVLPLFVQAGVQAGPFLLNVELYNMLA
jgi:hypothetical protein